MASCWRQGRRTQGYSVGVQTRGAWSRAAELCIETSLGFGASGQAGPERQPRITDQHHVPRGAPLNVPGTTTAAVITVRRGPPSTSASLRTTQSAVPRG